MDYPLKSRIIIASHTIRPADGQLEEEYKDDTTKRHDGIYCMDLLGEGPIQGAF